MRRSADRGSCAGAGPAHFALAGPRPDPHRHRRDAARPRLPRRGSHRPPRLGRRDCRRRLPPGRRRLPRRHRSAPGLRHRHRQRRRLRARLRLRTGGSHGPAGDGQRRRSRGVGERAAGVASRRRPRPACRKRYGAGAPGVRLEQPAAEGRQPHGRFRRAGAPGARAGGGATRWHPGRVPPPGRRGRAQLPSRHDHRVHPAAVGSGNLESGSLRASREPHTHGVGPRHA